MLTIDELAAEAAAISVVAIKQADRDEFAVALVLQGYEPRRAHQMAYETLADNDGALQMLARQRRRVAWAAALPKEGEEETPDSSWNEQLVLAGCAIYEQTTGEKPKSAGIFQVQRQLAERLGLSSLPVRSGEVAIRARAFEEAAQIADEGVGRGSRDSQNRSQAIAATIRARAALAPPPQAQEGGR